MIFTTDYRLYIYYDLKYLQNGDFLTLNDMTCESHSNPTHRQRSLSKGKKKSYNTTQFLARRKAFLIFSGEISTHNKSKELFRLKIYIEVNFSNLFTCQPVR